MRARAGGFHPYDRARALGRDGKGKKGANDQNDGAVNKGTGVTNDESADGKGKGKVANDPSAGGKGKGANAGKAGAFAKGPMKVQQARPEGGCSKCGPRPGPKGPRTRME